MGQIIIFTYSVFHYMFKETGRCAFVLKAFAGLTFVCMDITK